MPGENFHLVIPAPSLAHSLPDFRVEFGNGELVRADLPRLVTWTFLRILNFTSAVTTSFDSKSIVEFGCSSNDNRVTIRVIHQRSRGGFQ